MRILLGALEAAAHTVGATVAALKRFQARWREAVSELVATDPQPDTDPLVDRLLPLLPGRPVLTPAAAAVELQIPVALALLVLERLRVATVVSKSAIGVGVDGYFAVEVLELVADATQPTSQTSSLREGRPLASGYNYYAHGGSVPPPVGFEVPAS